MPITVQYTPVSGVAQLARRGGQQQQMVREQSFQWQQDLIGLQANLQQTRDVMLNQFQQQRDIALNQFQQQATLQAQQYQTAQQERKYQWLDYQTRQDREFQEEMAELQIEQYKDRQKFDVQLENEQYVAKRNFDFEMELQGLAAESQFKMQLEQQQIMGDLAEQQMKQQQKKKESEAVIKAIQENAYLSPEEQARAITAYQTKQTAMMKPTKNVAISNKARQLAQATGQDLQFTEDMLNFVPTLPNELQDFAWEAYRNPSKRQAFYNLYQAWGQQEQQKLKEEFGLAQPQETPQQRRARKVPAWRADSTEKTQQWDKMSPAQKEIEAGQLAGIKTIAQQQVTGIAKEAERQEHLKMAIKAESRATRNYHLREAGINPNDLDTANRLVKEHDKAWSKYNSAYNEWLGEFEDENIERLKGDRADRESRLRTRFTEAAEDMNRIETQLKQLSEEFKKQTSPFPEYPNAYFENGSWYIMKNGQRYRIEE